MRYHLFCSDDHDNCSAASQYHSSFDDLDEVVDDIDMELLSCDHMEVYDSDLMQWTKLVRTYLLIRIR